MLPRNVRVFSKSLHLEGNFKPEKCLQCGCMNRISSVQNSRYSSNTGSQSDSGNASNNYMGRFLVGAGVSFSAYMLWSKRRRLLAEDFQSMADDTTESTQQDLPTDEPSPLPADESGPAKEEIDWSLIPDIPSHVPYLLIGGGIASLEAFKAIKTKDIKAKVLMIADEEYPPYWRPPLSKHFWYDENPEAYKDFSYSNTRGKKSSVFLASGLYMEPKKLSYSDRGGLALMTKTKVAKLDAVNKKVTLDNGTEISFNKCLIATGGTPKNDTVIAKSGDEVKARTTLFRNYSDLWKLSEVCKTAKSVAVIGGGFLGSELAVGMAYKGATTGLKVYQIFPEKGNMAKVLPGYLSDWTTSKVRQDGVTVKPNASLSSAVFENGKVKLRLSNGEYLEVDHVVVAVGIEPNTDLADSADLELDDKYGGYLVNTELLARTDIWVAGDCACFFDPKLGRRRVEHFDHASITGRLAGFNMAGENKPYIHQSMFWSTLGSSIDYEAVGLVDSKLKTFAAFRKKCPEELEPEKENKDEDNSKDKAIRADKKSSGTVRKTASATTSKSKDAQQEKVSLEDDYDHGVIFYLKEGEVVGVVLWNLTGFWGDPSRLDIARQVIADGAKGKDLTEVAKLFNIYAR